MALLGADGAPKVPTSLARIAITVAGLIGIMMVMLSAFALPAVKSTPRDIPITVVASEAQRTQIITAINAAGQGAFEVTSSDSPEAARQRIGDRTVYGALIVDDNGLTLQTASAASSAVAAALTQLAQQVAAATNNPVKVIDLRPFPSSDSRGVGLSAGALPIALGGWIAAVAIIATIIGSRQRLLAAAAFAIAGGFALTGLLHGIGTLAGHYVATSFAASLGIAATSFLVLGLERLLHGVGIAIAAITLILLGNPLSGLSSAPEMLPRPWGTLGQLLPPGATGTLLRNVAFFDGAAITAPLLVLTTWLVIGLGAFVLSGLRKPGTLTVTEPAAAAQS